MKEIVIGEEHDSELKEAIISHLKQIGAICESYEWGLGGSQELCDLKFRIDDSILYIHSETYIGLLIKGPEDIVDPIMNFINDN